MALEILSFLVSPVLGAVIGYSTNWLAIRMLFRPLREKRLFGKSLPFTPGLIIKEMPRIAESVSKALAQSVLTEEELVKAVSSPEVMDKLVGMLDGFLSGLSRGDYDEKLDAACETAAKWLTENLAENESLLGSYISDGLQDKAREAFASRVPKLSDTLRGLLEKHPEAEAKLSELVRKVAEENFGSFLGVFLRYGTLYDRIKTGLFNYLEEPENQRYLTEKGLDFFDAYMAKEVREVAGKLTAGAVASPDETTVTEAPELSGSIEKLLKSLARGLAHSAGGDRAVAIREAVIRALRLIVAKGGAYVVTSMQFDKLVEDKINTFSAEETERLILDVIGRELKVITALGGVLGFVIGFAPVLMNALGLN